MMLDLAELLVREADTVDPLNDPLFILLIVISVIAIIVSAIVGTLYGRKKRAEVESRIAERRKRRRQAKEETAKRERDMIKRYEEAKKRAAEEVAKNPQAYLPMPEITDEEVRPITSGGGVRVISTTGPRYMKVDGDLGVSGSEPVRLSETARPTEPIKAKVVASRPLPPAKAETKVATAKAKAAPAKKEEEKEEEKKEEAVAAGPPKAEEKKEEKKEEKEEEEDIPEVKEEKDEEDEDDGLSELEKMLANLDNMK